MNVKLISSLTKKIYVLELTEKRTVCPECSHNRRKSKEKVVFWNLEEKRGFCHHCETTFFEYNAKEKIEYIAPKWKNVTNLTDHAVKWFNARVISQNTLNKLKVYSDREFMPQFGKEVEVICFPYFVNDKLVNIKYRGPKKAFKLHAGSELVMWNINRIGKEVIFVEGEIDLLSFIEAGHDNVLSVPNGAATRLDYLDNYMQLFDNVEKIYLAVDNDAKGLLLRDELARRFGAEICWLVDFGLCKDANQFLMENGAMRLGELIKESNPYPVRGIVYIDSLYHDILVLKEEGIKPGLKIGEAVVDRYIGWELGRLAIGTGIPGHYKSTFIDYLVTRLNLLYGWKAAFFTPENYPLKFHYSKMYSMYMGYKFGKKEVASSEEDFDVAYEYLRDNFFYIMDEEEYGIDMILDAAKSLVRAKGIKILVIDPYNKLDHVKNKGESETDYVSRFLDKLLRFAQINGVLIFLVAHPRKMQKKKGEEKFDIPTLYDISGSAHFYNKADYGFTTYRETADDGDGTVLSNNVNVHWQKIKFYHLGELGVSDLRFNINNGRFIGGHQDAEGWDNSNWLLEDTAFSDSNENVDDVELFDDNLEGVPF